MRTPPFKAPQLVAGGRAARERLESWKEIAAYLNRDVRTVQRWEQTRDLPVHRLPGGGRGAVFALRSELDAWWRDAAAAVEEGEPVAASLAVPTVPSVAVLPFANLAADKENEYFSDGLADEIITALTHVEGLRVTARTSSFAFRGKEQDVREVGARLGVGALLEGSVRRAGGHIRVSAQLVNAADGYHLWSERYDRELTDVFAIQDDIARSIAAALRLKLTPQATLVKKKTENLEAYSLWLQGRYCRYRLESVSDLMKAGECFTQALALDPNYAAAHLGLAEHFRYLAALGFVPPQQAAARGGTEVERALELDDTLGEAHALSGAFRAVFDFDWAGAGAAFRKALGLDPGSAFVSLNYAVCVLMPMMRLEEAEAELSRTLELDPLSPDADFWMTSVLWFKREYDRAEARLRVAAEVRPNDPSAEWLRGVVAATQGRFEEGVAHCERAVALFGGVPLPSAGLGMLYGWAGRVDEARRILDELERAAQVRYVSPIYRAWVHMSLGEADQAFEWLERAIESRDPQMIHLPGKPVYDSLRGDARFGALLRRIGL